MKQWVRGKQNVRVVEASSETMGSESKGVRGKQ